MKKFLVKIQGKTLQADLAQGVDLSLVIGVNPKAASAWYVNPATITPVKGEGFIGSVAEGGSVNFRDITFNPHGNGTHTECLGHITPEVYNVNEHIREHHLIAEVKTFTPKKEKSSFNRDAEDHVIHLNENSCAFQEGTEALILRTTPNSEAKRSAQYSNSNPPYLSASSGAYLNACGIKHLLIDLPSVDREVDGGQLINHHAFWGLPDAPRFDASITEFIYVPSQTPDGLYYLNLQIAAFENDAAPSRPVIYPLYEP